jgi:hypothetical protein
MRDGSASMNIDALKEINRRYDLVEKGLCSYCGRDPSTPLCRLPEMHVLPLMAIQQHEE